VVAHGGLQISPGKNRKLHTNAVTNTRGRLTDDGLCHWRLAYPRHSRLTVLRFRSVPCCIYDFHQTTPRGAALVFGVGFSLSRFQKDFHLQLSAHAGRDSLIFGVAALRRKWEGERESIVLACKECLRRRPGPWPTYVAGPCLAAQQSRHALLPCALSATELHGRAKEVP
jgi:hypothetical protein